MKKNTEKNGQKKVTRREFLAGAAAAGAVVALGGLRPAFAAMAPAPKGLMATVPEIVPKNPGELRILQVTDIHYAFIARGISAEPQKMKDIAGMVAKFQPDIIINTGDFWVRNDGGIGNELCKWATAEFAKLKTPWAYAWGNHDEAPDYNLCHETMEKAPHSLYRGGAADGNYRIAVTDAAGAPKINLIILNNSRGGFKQEQIDWFNAEAERIKQQTPASPPALLFFHIPLPQYDDLAAAGKCKGVKFEKVCHEDGSREAFTAFKKSGFVRAAFCGHDHVNDYYGDFKGIRLQYGRALGGYGADKVRKGGTLITVDTNTGDFETKTVFGDGTSKTFDKFITVPEPGVIY